MKRISLSSFFLMSFLMLTQAQTHYYKLGQDFVPYDGDEFWWTKAYDTWKEGEQKGEAASARMVILCLIYERGTDQNIELALNKIQKWYTKDSEICRLGALLYFPKQYNFKPGGFSGIHMAVHINDTFHNLEDYGKAADLEKSIFYYKYLIEHFEEDAWYDKQYFNGILSICYEYGLAGYEKDIKQAAYYANKSIDVNGNKRSFGNIKLFDNAQSINDLYNLIAEIDPKHADLDYLLRGPDQTPPYSWDMPDYWKTYCKKRDSSFEEFCSKSKEDQFQEYNNSTEGAQKLYDNLFQNKMRLRSLGVNSDIDALTQISKQVKEYPNSVVSAEILNQYNQVLNTIVDGVANKRHPLNERLEDLLLCKRLLDVGFFTENPETWDMIVSNNSLECVEDCKQKKEKILTDLDDFFKEEPQSFRDFILSPCKNIINNINAVKVINNDNIPKELLGYDEFTTEACDFAHIYGWEEDENGKFFFKDDNESIDAYSQYLQKYSNSDSKFVYYAKIRHIKLIDRRNNRAALDAALSLTTNSKKKDINNVLNMPMTSSFKVKLNEIVKKKMIKLHEQYKSSGKEEEFLEIINEYIGNEL